LRVNSTWRLEMNEEANGNLESSLPAHTLSFFLDFNLQIL
jgi:hypothetical protein